MGEQILNTPGPRTLKEEKPKEKIGAFFDFDGTVVSKNTGRGFFIFLIKKRKLSLFKVFYVGLVILRKILGNIDYYAAMNKIYTITKGMKIEEIRGLAKEYYENNIDRILRKDVVDKIIEHRSKGAKIVLATNAWDESSKLFAKHLEFDVLLATEIEEVEGAFTGVVSKHCFGDYKSTFLENFAKENNINLEKSYAYSDSIKDIPMLNLVGNRFAVYPTRGLRRYAKRHGIDIIE